MSLTPINGNGWGLAPDIFHPYHTHTYILIHRFLVGDSIAIKLDSSPSTSSPKRRGAVLELFHIHHLWLGHAHRNRILPKAGEFIGGSSVSTKSGSTLLKSIINPPYPEESRYNCSQTCRIPNIVASKRIRGEGEGDRLPGTLVLTPPGRSPALLRRLTALLFFDDLLLLFRRLSLALLRRTDSVLTVLGSVLLGINARLPCTVARTLIFLTTRFSAFLS
jgi:hypothetical protein